MKGTDTKAMSRPTGVAELLIGHSVSREEVFSKKVVLTGDREALATQNGRLCFLNCLRLLPRLVGHLEVLIPPDLREFEEKVRDLANSVYKTDLLELRYGSGRIDVSAAAILSIGFHSQHDLPWIAINSNGWVARVASGGEELSRDMDQFNPIGALMAASLGVAEVFKRVYGVPSDVAAPMDKIEFSLYDYTTSPATLGPDLPASITFPDALLIGGGAIGSGITLLLSQLNLEGRLHIIDKQAYAVENYGTCVLLDDSGWIGSSKAECLAGWLNGRSSFHASSERALIANARSGEAVKSMNVDLIFNGLDDVPARHDAQLLWPSVIVDGGINAIGAGVVTHRLDHPEGACLRCTFSVSLKDEKGLQSKATGLSRASLASDLGRPLTSADVEQAEEGRRPWLRARLAEGKTLCATITEAQSELQLGVELEEGFQPSAPFVATASAALMIGEALKALVYPEAEYNHSFQLANLFLGPSSSVASLRRSSPTCDCVTHRSLILELANKRRSA